MKVDLRDKLKKDRMMRDLPNNHRKNFEQLLRKELHQKPKNSYTFLKIAASVLLIFSLSFAGYQIINPSVSQDSVMTKDVPSNKINSMADISPDLKRVENFYLTQINYQLAKIEITDENRDLLEVYLSELDVLQKEYNSLNKQLTASEVSEKTIDALIENLQLRLQLLRSLKKKLKIIENTKSEENESKQA